MQSGCVSFWMSLGIFPLWLVCCPHRGVGYGFQVLRFRPGNAPNLLVVTVPLPSPIQNLPQSLYDPPMPKQSGQ